MAIIAQLPSVEVVVLRDGSVITEYDNPNGDAVEGSVSKILESAPGGQISMRVLIKPFFDMISDALLVEILYEGKKCKGYMVSNKYLPRCRNFTRTHEETLAIVQHDAKKMLPLEGEIVVKLFTGVIKEEITMNAQGHEIRSRFSKKADGCSPFAIYKFSLRSYGSLVEMLNTQRSPSRSPPPEVQQALGFLLAAAHFDSIDPKTLSEFMQAFDALLRTQRVPRRLVQAPSNAFLAAQPRLKQEPTPPSSQENSPGKGVSEDDPMVID